MSKQSTSAVPAAPQASRRALLFGIAAVGAVASPAVASALLEAPKAPAIVEAAVASPADVAIPSPDAALLQIFDEYMATVAEYDHVYGLYQRGRAKHQAEYPMPQAMQVQPGDAELGLPEGFKDERWPLSYVNSIRDLKEPEWPVYDEVDAPEGMRFWYTSGGTVYRREPPSAVARARADEIIEAHDKWWDKYWRYPREVRSFERQADRANKRKDKLRAKIDRRRAHTIAGLAAKAQVAAIEGEEDTQFADTTLESILRDMRAMSRRGLA